MSRVFFFIGEGLRALRRSTAPSIAAITTVAVTVVLLGILIPVLQATSSKTNEVRDQVGLRVFLYPDGTPEETQALQTKIEGIPHVKSVEYVVYQVPLAAHHDPQIHVHAVAASPTGFILESFADPTRDPLWFELFAERPTIVDGFMAVPDAPGLGLELRRDTLEKYGVRLQ